MMTPSEPDVQNVWPAQWPREVADLAKASARPLDVAGTTKAPWLGDYELLTRGEVVVTAAPWRSLVRVTGADAGRFLNGQTTCEVAELLPGQSVYGFFTNAKGRVHADAHLHRGDSGWWLDVPTLACSSLVAHLQKYSLFDDVEVVQVHGVLAASLLGETGYEVLRRVTERDLAGLTREGCHVSLEEGSMGILLARFPRWGMEHQVSIFLFPTELPRGEEMDEPSPAVSGGELWLRSLQVPYCAFDAVEAVRVTQAVPRFGVDFDADCIPQETGRESEAVSYSKGCYLGQEVVARVHFLGQPARSLVRLEVSGAAAQGDEVSFEGAVVGVMSSLVTVASGQQYGMSILRQRSLPPEARLEVGASGAWAYRSDLSADEGFGNATEPG